jgi:hypothetical protein
LKKSLSSEATSLTIPMPKFQKNSEGQRLKSQKEREPAGGLFLETATESPWRQQPRASDWERRRDAGIDGAQRRPQTECPRLPIRRRCASSAGGTPALPVARASSHAARTFLGFGICNLKFFWDLGFRALGFRALGFPLLGFSLLGFPRDLNFEPR